MELNIELSHGGVKWSNPMKTPLQRLAILALACAVVLNAADTSRDVTLASRGPWSSIGDTQLMIIKPDTPSTLRLVIADEPTKAKEASVEIVYKSEGDFALPALTLNGQPVRNLKTTRSKTEIILTSSAPDLRQALKRGYNSFTFTSQNAVTLSSLSVSIVP
jgi:hypothetical protein